MGADATRDLVTRMYAAAAGGDLGALAEILAPDLVVEEPDFLPYGGTYRGIEAFAGLFGEVEKVLDLANLVLEGLTADDDYAYARVRVPQREGGEARIVEEWQIRDGRVAHARVFWLNAS